MTSVQDLQAYAVQAAQRAGVDPGVFSRMINQESGWQTDAQSPAGALGIAQFMPGTASDMGINPMDPFASLDAAARYLRSGVDQFGSYPLALAAYNAGAGAVEQYGGVPPFAETQNYVNTIMGGSNVAQPTDSGSGSGTSSDGSTDWGGAAQQLDDVLSAIISQKPDPNDPKYQVLDPAGGVGADGRPKTNDAYVGSYTDALSAWAVSYKNVAAAQKSLQATSLGLSTLPDGTVVASTSLTPEQTAAVTASNIAAYTKILNQYGLDKYNLVSGATKDVNSTIQSGFNNRVTALNLGISLDTHNLTAAQAELSRWMDGQDVANQDVQNVQAAQDQAVKYGTSNGQTSFSAADLGGGVSALANQAGIPTSSPILQYPGYENMDPLATRAASLAGMGISAAPPMLPTPTVSAAQLPQAPQLLAPPGPPQVFNPYPNGIPAAVGAAPQLQVPPTTGQLPSFTLNPNKLNGDGMP